MPIILNEPLSFLQRLVEYMEYVDLLEKASEESDPVGRMQYVAAFAVSAVSCNWQRIGKPFNPLLGETYELERDNFRVICEQVSHHPPISAFHAENEVFSFHGSIYPKPKLWGKNIEIQPEGIVTAELKKWDEAYTWSNVTCSVHNVVVGKIWIEQSGTMEITNHKTGHRAVLNFKSSGWFSKDMNRVEGFVFDRSKKKMKFLYGRWSDHMKATDMYSFEEFVKENCHRYKIGDGKNSNDTSPTPNTPKRVLSKFNSFKMGSSMFKSMSQAERDDIDDENGDIDESKSDSPFVIDIPNSITLWEVNPRKEKPLNDGENNGSYHFSEFTKSLNRLDSDMIGRICPTDSRFRPDLRKLETNDIEGAASEKNRLEEKQRDVRSLRKRKKIPDWNPRWFYLKTNPYTNQEDWYYNGKYWDRNFHSDPDIF
ncbi:oxysterol-binding protein-related protein 1 [Planococcus citri]|uniref:oxysterol-binding protein-related protein 1 n=1 Tax=Planococcus citri TaxID=170843 RepID=UPI0031F9DB62